MFVRFRQTKTTLQVTLLIGRRVNGRVRHEQVASLGSVKLPLTIDRREAFWVELHQVIARIGNRVGAAEHGKIFGDVHGRIPMVSPAERSAHEIALAEREQKIFEMMHDMLASDAAGSEQIANKATIKRASSQHLAEDAARRSAEAADRAARLRRGEHVPNGKPIDVEAVLREAGWTSADMRHASVLASLPEAALAKLASESVKVSERAERAMARRMAGQK